jgi:hypothetical protein
MKPKRNVTQAKDSGVCGAMAELYASVFFMDQGYHVYRSLSRTGLHDLIIIREDKIKTVQVGTGRVNAETGSIYFKKIIKTCKSDYLFIYHQSKSVFIDVKSSALVDTKANSPIYSPLPNPIKLKPGNCLKNVRLGEKTLADTIGNSKGGEVDEMEWRRRFYEAYSGAKESRRAAFYRARKKLITEIQESMPIPNSSKIL